MAAESVAASACQNWYNVGTGTLGLKKCLFFFFARELCLSLNKQMRVGAMAYTQNVTQETTTNWPSVTKKNNNNNLF